MDVYEATKIVLSKIQSLDPENASKIMGLLLIQDHGEKEIIRLAFGPESLLHSVVLKARKELSMNSSSFKIQEQLGTENPDLFYRSWPETHRRGDVLVGGSDDLSGFGWKPCLYYARGYCKNGTNCKFLHAGEMIPQSVDFLLHQQQGDSTGYTQLKLCELMMGHEDMNIFGRSGIMNPVSRQIYLTFPADSSFREEDVSIYFSIYGPVQDVRIPYQQKRMFGFVTFVYPETVKMILAKGNPHFVCDSRVLVKPYKEKGKINLDKFRKQQQFFGSTTDFDSVDPFDIPIGPRMFTNSQELLWRKKLEEEADLQQAIEIQAKRLMGFHFLNQNHHRSVSAGAGAGGALSSPTSHFCSPTASFYSDQFNQKVTQMNCLSPSMADEKSLTITTSSQEESETPESNSSLEHNLPDSPFASPKASSGAGDYVAAFLEEEEEAATTTENNTNIGGSLAISSSFIPTNAQTQLMAFPSTKKVVYW